VLLAVSQLRKDGIEMVTEVERKGLVVLDPTAEPIAGEVTLAPRPDSLDGKTIGLLDNSKLNSDRFLDLLVEELSESYSFAGIVRARKPTASRVVPDETLKEFAEKCDVVITAVGD
jgi:hypothetical protein